MLDVPFHLWGCIAVEVSLDLGTEKRDPKLSCS